MRPTIIYVHPHLMMRGGATNFALDTALGLQERGWPVKMIVGRADPAIVGTRQLDIVELGGPLPSNPMHWLTLKRLEARLYVALDSIRNKILFPQVLPANYWAFLYRAARPWVPCVWMCQEPSAFVHSWRNIQSLVGPMRIATLAANPVLQVLDRLLVTRSDLIIANSHFTAEAIYRIYRRKAITIAYPPVSTDDFRTRAVARNCILSLGRLTRFKRVDLVIRGYAQACNALGKSLPDLVIAGTGPELSSLQNLASQLKVGEHVHFTGDVSDMERRELYARALLFVATAPNEPFGITCIEAMASGAPVLAPNRGGPSETVVHGVTGAVYRAGEVDDLAIQLARLLSNRSDLRLAGQRAAGHVQNRFSLSQAVDSIEAVLLASVRRS